MKRKNGKKTVLYLICGLPGSGKTTLARKLESEKGATRFSPDEAIVALFGEDIAKDKARLYAVRDIVEARQRDQAEEMLVKGVDVILENGFWGRDERQAWRDKAQELDAVVELYFLDVPLETLWSRLAKRNANLPPATFQVERHELAEWWDMFEAPGADENPKRIED